jgi:hypothetical protein
LAVQVGDTIGGGTSVFYALMDEVAKDLKLGSVERCNFNYRGLRVTTVNVGNKNSNEFELVVDGDEYLDCLVGMNVPSGEAEEPLLPAAALEYMSVVGSVNYVASSFRPDVSVDASILGRAFARPTIRDARKANATLAWIQQNRYPHRFRKGASQLTAFCDSAVRVMMVLKAVGCLHLQTMMGIEFADGFIGKARKLSVFADRLLQERCFR